MCFKVVIALNPSNLLFFGTCKVKAGRYIERQIKLCTPKSRKSNSSRDSFTCLQCLEL